MGTIKGVGWIYQQTFMDTDRRLATAKLYTDKSVIAAADLINDRVVSFFDKQRTGRNASSPTGTLGTAPINWGNRRPTPTRCTWQWSTSIILGPRSFIPGQRDLETVPRDPLG